MSKQTDGNTGQNELLTVQEVALYFRVSRVTAWRWCQQGVIPAFRIGHRWRIRRDALTQLIDTHESENLSKKCELA